MKTNFYISIIVSVMLGMLFIAPNMAEAKLLFSEGNYYPVCNGCQSVAMGDLDGDGDLDLATSNVSILLGNGDGTFQNTVNYAADGSSVAIGDLDGDGDLDLAVAGDDVSILLGNGDGTFLGPISYSVYGNSIAIGDLDGNGDLDLAVAGNKTCGWWGHSWPCDEHVSVLLGNGDGSFQSEVRYDPSDYEPKAVAMGDLDGDGDLDLAVGGVYYVSILLGNGDGTFQAPVVIYEGEGGGSVAIADLDGDGNLDLAIASNGVWVLLGNGDGTFQNAVNYAAGGSSEAIGDLDGDGDLDLVTSNVSILLGNGDGTFQNTVNYAADGSSVAIGDLDGDGDLDLAVAGDGVSIFINISCQFADVFPGYWAEDAIYKIYEDGITKGCSQNPLKYCPNNIVTRTQMAVFLGRTIHGSSFTPPAPTGIFDDVPFTYWAADWIEQFYNDGITSGCSTNPLKYCPYNPVTRAQMAIFLLRSKHGSNYTPPPATGIFSDVPASYWAASWIEQLYKEGITTGCGTNPLRYCTENSVTRAQMAVFITRTFGLTLDDGLVGLWKFDDPSKLGLDSSGYENHGGVSSPDVTYIEVGKINGAAKFTEGTIDVAIKIPHSESLNLTDQITAAAWVNLNGLGTDNGDAIFSKDGISQPYAFFALLHDYSNEMVAYFSGTGIRSEYVVIKQLWNHLAMTYDENTIKFYVNGILVDDKASSIGLNQDNNSDLYIGASPWGASEDFSGLIDEARIYKRTLSEAEIKVLYNLGN